MKWYISGKITDLPADQVTAKFEQAAQQIRAFGHEPVSPIDNGLDKAAHWNEHIVADIALLLECDAIYLLKDWGDSKGSRIEANISEECGLEIVYQPDTAHIGARYECGDYQSANRVRAGRRRRASRHPRNAGDAGKAARPSVARQPRAERGNQDKGGQGLLRNKKVKS